MPDVAAANRVMTGSTVFAGPSEPNQILDIISADNDRIIGGSRGARLSG